MGAILYLAAGSALILLAGWSVQDGARRIRSWAEGISVSSGGNGGRRQPRSAAQDGISGRQGEAEDLLARLAAGDTAAAERIFAESDRWIGTTHRTTRANRLVVAALDQHNLQLRAAALQATLGLDGVSQDQAGLNRLEAATGDATTRAWALWMLGALGNRGVQQERIVQILRGYVDDADASTRSRAVDGLAIVGSDETLQLVLDRFRNDPSPFVQQGAARSLAEAGMYTRAQRMVAAASLVGWIDDAGLSAPQKQWAAHALRDISGRDFGVDGMAWREWYGGTR